MLTISKPPLGGQAQTDHLTGIHLVERSKII